MTLQSRLGFMLIVFVVGQMLSTGIEDRAGVSDDEGKGGDNDHTKSVSK